jgi:hypothetical protein
MANTDISPAQAKAQIEIIITNWEKRNPQIAREFRDEMEYTRSIQDNNFASSKSNSFRFGLLIDATLQAKIERAFPAVFKDKDQFRWFMNNFPQFRVAERV